MISGRIIKPKEDDTQRLGLPRIGMIKIGEEKKKNAPGPAIDYFRATGNYKNEFVSIFGEKPNRLQIVFPSADPTQVCFQRIEGWTSDARKAFISDGVNYMLFSDKTGGYELSTEDEVRDAIEKGLKVTTGYGANKKQATVKIQSVSEMLTLRFILLKMSGIMGYWELSTKGAASSIPNITQTFDEVANRAGNYISNVPFDLSVAFAKSYKPGSQSRFPVLTLTPNISYENTLLLEEFKDSGIKVSKLITDDNIDNLLNNNVPDSKQLPSHVSEPEQKNRIIREILSPEKLKKGIAKKVLSYGNDDKLIGTDVNLTSDLHYRFDALANEEDASEHKRKVSIVLNFLVGKQSIDDLTISEGKSLIDWMGIDDGTIIDETITEYNKILDLYDTNQKQSRMY